ncbi:protein Sape [Campylobacter sputorum subsp. bubulus]|uniref:Protein Sape n=1 Tax=Campylobacter sputorum subsp. sputorum TaxID=32024 RepID=A0A381DJA2_9BACT|nr:HlyD family type I secretion periplasmic adaptor subunit [Campylobacter sputorum]ASM35803.1 type I secretion system, membrane fusion protein, HlyD family [Campylobacter sputorum aubsp. sputorum RM3237]KAB0581509.1 HlyD family type I secretion periplasmic adaptor subunit [Campylobacter sputorum subsp. sputorum]QEL05993.1 type I secretion system membrane fusion protein, HlyD family [Campylobacter sputorum subsp. sputorum]SUX09093.1 protein Sape [Campylobacter sputorum subsp. bubulus]SUX10784.
MILKNENPTIRFGIFIIFLLVGVFGLWIGLAPLHSAAVAVGKVSVISNKKTIQHLEGGVIDKIYVKDGDHVKIGDPLVEISNAMLDSQMQILRSNFLQNSTLVSRLEAQKDDAKTITFSDEIDGFEDASMVKNAQITIFNEQSKLLNDEIDILNQRIAQLQKQISGTKAVAKAKEERITSIKEEMKEWQKLFDEQLTDKVRLRELQREETTLKGDLASLNAEIAKLEVQITETKSQIVFRKTSFKEDILKKLEVAKNDLINVKEKYKALKDQSNRTLLKSPVDGTIVELQLHTIGGVIRPGEKVMSIIPSETDFIIEAKLKTTDIDTVSVGLDADIRFSAFNTQQSHVIEGKVIYISADSLEDQRGYPYYELKAVVTKEGMKNLQNNKFFLLPGMPAEVIIKTGERTVLNYFLKPFTDMFKRAFNEE